MSLRVTKRDTEIMADEEAALRPSTPSMAANKDLHCRHNSGIIDVI